MLIDEVVIRLLQKLLDYREEIVKFGEVHNLDVSLEAYIVYERDRPLIGLESETIEILASFKCSLGLEVLHLPNSEETLALDGSGYE